MNRLRLARSAALILLVSMLAASAVVAAKSKAKTSSSSPQPQGYVAELQSQFESAISSWSFPPSAAYFQQHQLLFTVVFAVLTVAFYLMTPGSTTKLRGGSQVGKAHVRTEGYEKALLTPPDEFNNLSDILRDTARRTPNATCIKERGLISREVVDGKFEKLELSDYKSQTFKEVAEEVATLLAGLRSLGITFGSTVGIAADTCSRWQKTAQACFAGGFPIVTAYTTLGEDALRYGLNLTSVRYLVCDYNMVKTVASILQKSDSSDDVSVEKLIVFAPNEDIAQESIKAAKFPAALEVMTYESLLQRGQSASKKDWSPSLQAPGRQDIAMYMFTSGTTGNPKAVTLSHENILTGVDGLMEAVQIITPDDVVFCYLPLAHVRPYTPHGRIGMITPHYVHMS